RRTTRKQFVRPRIVCSKRRRKSAKPSTGRPRKAPVARADRPDPPAVRRAMTWSMPNSRKSILATGELRKRGFMKARCGELWEYDMTANRVDNDVDPSAAGQRTDDDPAAEIASLRERLLRALAETENTR